MKRPRPSSIQLYVNWTPGEDHFRSDVVGGMQIEVFKRDDLARSFFNQKWEYRLWNSQGVELCWGMAHTKSEIKRVSVMALTKRLVSGGTT